MVKRLVPHEHFGEGRVVALDDASFGICFVSRTGAEAKQVFGGAAIDHGFLTLLRLAGKRQEPK